MLAAAAKRTKRTLFDDPYRTLVSNSNKSNNNNIKKTHSLCQFALETLDDNVLKRTAPWRTCHHVFPSNLKKHQTLPLESWQNLPWMASTDAPTRQAPVSLPRLWKQSWNMLHWKGGSRRLDKHKKTLEFFHSFFLLNVLTWAIFLRLSGWNVCRLKWWIHDRCTEIHWETSMLNAFVWLLEKQDQIMSVSHIWSCKSPFTWLRSFHEAMKEAGEVQADSHIQGAQLINTQEWEAREQRLCEFSDATWFLIVCRIFSVDLYRVFFQKPDSSREKGWGQSPSGAWLFFFVSVLGSTCPKLFVEVDRSCSVHSKNGCWLSMSTSADMFI